MDGRKNSKQVVDAAAVLSGEGEGEGEGEREAGKQLKARKGYQLVATQFWPLMDKIDAWLEQHRSPQQEEAPTSDVEDEEEEEAPAPAPAPADRGEGLADTIRRLLRDLDDADDGDTSTTGLAAEGYAAGRRHEEA
ncbi:hypothetical protein GUJ93_ZPchr0005g14965 [Zizania palustris]|uniref:Uncharacterized protein n=1 Tax=Zizania palustris TaxID=103762 RepID=A0A8J5VQD6_ZIZPA|nr:hypothetical protein GUJ93_ZPchr0005g14965 [Zizania palustris]